MPLWRRSIKSWRGCLMTGLVGRRILGWYRSCKRCWSKDKISWKKHGINLSSSSYNWLTGKTTSTNYSTLTPTLVCWTPSMPWPNPSKRDKPPYPVWLQQPKSQSNELNKYNLSILSNIHHYYRHFYVYFTY